MKEGSQESFSNIIVVINGPLGNCKFTKGKIHGLLIRLHELKGMGIVGI